MTLHNAKGLEYPTVFITGCEDGVFPHSRAIDEGGLEEERRLFYVGVTRAMRELYLTYARRRAVFGAQTLRDAEPLPRRDPRRPARGAARDGASGRRDRAPCSGRRGRRRAAARTGGDRRAAAGAREPRRGRVRRFRLGEDVVHAAFGDGVVTGVEPDGVIVVRFAGDGSERKLMAEYAPVTRR